MRNTRLMNPKLLTPQEKAVMVNTILGNPNIANQQTTSRVLYDTLPLDGRREFRFFESVNNRTFPDTNLTQNKLQVGETFALERIYFVVVITDPVTGETTDVVPIYTSTLVGLYLSDMTIHFDTQQVVKPYPLTSMMREFSHVAINTNNEHIELDSLLVIPTDIQFRCELDTVLYTPLENASLRCVWEGFGTLLSVKAQL